MRSDVDKVRKPRGQSSAIAALALVALVAGCGPRNAGRVPNYYPSNYHETIDDAGGEGRVVVWSAIAAGTAAPLIADFEQHFPRVRVDYVELPGGELNTRFLAAATTGKPVPDFLWSSAMDLQIKLVNDGYAQGYASPEATKLPSWSNWKGQAWGTTAEPIVFVYNRHLIDDAAMPQSHQALLRYLQARPKPPVGTVATYDVPRSAVGYLYQSQDQEASHENWELVAAMAASGIHVFDSAEQIMDDVRSGRAAIGYNIVGSFAVKQAGGDRRIGMVLPRDYSLVVSRIAVIPSQAPHPNAAHLFLDFVLSHDGQRHLVAAAMPSVRADVAPPRGLEAGTIPLRAIRVGPGLLVDSDRLTRASTERRWDLTMHGHAPPGD